VAVAEAPGAPPASAFFDEHEEPQSALASAASAILSPAQLVALAAELPRAVRGYGGRRWALLFSLRRHGASLETLLNRAAGRAATLLVVRDDRGAVFGAFAPEPWQRVKGYFGSGDSWVFTFERRERADRVRAKLLEADARRARMRDEEERLAGGGGGGDGDGGDGGGGGGGGGGGAAPAEDGSAAAEAEAEAAPPPLAAPAAGAGAAPEPRAAAPNNADGPASPAAPRRLHVYRWTKRNKLYQYVSLQPSAKQVRIATGLGVGGGAHFALHLDDHLDRGCSGPCQTFLSPPLARGEGEPVGEDGGAGAGAGAGAESGGADAAEAAAAGDAMALEIDDLGRDGAFRAVDVELFEFR